MMSLNTVTFNDLQIIQKLAQTHSGTTIIYLCRYNNEYMVCKSMNKQVIRNDAIAVEHAKNQKQILKHFTLQNRNQRICQLYGVFQDEDNLYLLLEMVEGLPLHKLMQMIGALKLNFVKIIGLQVALILRDFHGQGFIYRDIKSSNFMVDMRGVVKMIDLGKAKQIGKSRTYTVCGTTHAMPPEVSFSNLGKSTKTGYSYEFDYYSFGVLIYELLTGSAPFGYGNSNKNITQDVSRGLSQETLHSKINDSHARTLISGLMKLEPTERLGNQGGFEEIISHPFFNDDSALFELATKIWKGEEHLSPYDEEYCEYISEIEDVGINKQKYGEITEDDPFFKFS